METKDIIDKFLITVKETKSENTFRSYKDACECLSEYLMSGNLSIYFMLEQQEINRFIEHLRQKGYSDTTIKRNVSVLRGFLKFCITNRILPDRDIYFHSNTENPKVFFASKEDVAKLYKYCVDYDADAEYFSIRAKLVTLFVLLFGLKVSELCDLKVGDVLIENGTISTHNALKFIYNEKFIPHFKALLKHREETLLSITDEDNDYLFITRFGRKCSTNALNLDFQRICNELSLENITLSSLRNTCIIDYYDNFPDKTIISKVFDITERRIIELLEKRF